MTKIKHNELATMVKDIDAKGKDLTAWEIKFIGDLIDRQCSFFSELQDVTIRRIYEERVP